MQEMYQLFSNRVKKLLSDKIKGDIDVWVTDDTLNIKICKNDLMFNANIEIQNTSSGVKALYYGTDQNNKLVEPKIINIENANKIL